MMVEVDVSEGMERRDLYVFAGMDAIKRKRRNGWENKIGFCSKCGECCRTITNPDARRGDMRIGTPDGCMHLEAQGNEILCGLNKFRPFACAISELPIECCTVKWEKE